MLHPKIQTTKYTTGIFYLVFTGAWIYLCSISIGLSQEASEDRSNIYMKHLPSKKMLQAGCSVAPASAYAPALCHPVTKECSPEIPPYNYEILNCSLKDIRGDFLAIKEFHYASLSHSDFTRANLSFIDLRGAYGDWAKFDRIIARSADFSHGILIGASFISARLSHSKFLRSELLHANFTHAVLDHADFHSANLRRAQFVHADLRHASFQKAYLHYSSFDGADLQNANFTGATLQNVSFVGAKNLHTTQGLPEKVLKSYDQNSH